MTQIAGTQLIAEFTQGGQRSSPKITINRLVDGRRQHVETRAISGKREARAIAAARGAQPWNF